MDVSTQQDPLGRTLGGECARHPTSLWPDLGSLVIDDTDNKRSKSAKTLAHLYKLRDKESGGYVWGQSLVFLLVVTPAITLPVGFTFYQPAPS